VIERASIRIRLRLLKDATRMLTVSLIPNRLLIQTTKIGFIFFGKRLVSTNKQ